MQSGGTRNVRGNRQVAIVEANMELEEARRVLRDRLWCYLDGLDSTLREDVQTALAEEGKLLHQPVAALDGRWALLPFCLARAANPALPNDAVRLEAACHVALAMECVICATDLLDDVMDDDVTNLIAHLGIPRVLNAALALVSLSQRMLLTLLDLNLPATLPARLMDLVQSAILRASAGQQQDLLAERRAPWSLTREECLAIAAAKAGSLLALACQMGALCAGLNAAELERYAEVGRLLGIAAQLDNDAHDLYHLLQPACPVDRRKSDLARNKKTLPLVLAACVLQNETPADACNIDFRALDHLAERERERYLCALREGILSTWGLALLYRERAREQVGSLLGEHALEPALCRVLGLDRVLAEGAR